MVIRKICKSAYNIKIPAAALPKSKSPEESLVNIRWSVESNFRTLIVIVLRGPYPPLREGLKYLLTIPVQWWSAVLFKSRPINYHGPLQCRIWTRTIREKVATILLFRLLCGRSVVLGEDIFVIVLTLGFFDSGTFLVHRIVIDYIEVIHPLLLLSTTTTGAGCALLYRYIFL